MFEIFPRSQSFPLLEALKRYGDPQLVALLEAVSGPDAASQRREIGRELQRSLLPDLRKEALIATALQKPISCSATRSRISADIWKVLELDVDHGTGSYLNLSLTDIELQENAWVTRIFGLQHVAAVEGDLEEDVTEADESAQITLSEDLSKLTIGEKSWRLKGEIQQEIIRQLVEAFPNELKTTKVLDQAGSNVDTIAKPFNRSPNWPTLQHYIKRGDGICQLLAVPLETVSDEDVRDA
ncbi:hypothetical protein VW35_04200 [Devosia soli]|uniref:Uncharacterized protein n=1 Tax=Devosia soli TaxID=361041 RepID=A0A0F5LDQ1_9HYPH|nr:hypothetical protein [Devosia soli]KKB79722.1 hypothetical protein VW35_04200 [Devosia soli]